MPLDDSRRKRNLSQSPEPTGKTPLKGFNAHLWKTLHDLSTVFILD